MKGPVHAKAVPPVLETSDRSVDAPHPALAQAALRETRRHAQAAQGQARAQADEMEVARLDAPVDWAYQRRELRRALRRAGIPASAWTLELSEGISRGRPWGGMTARVNGHALRVSGTTLTRLDGEPLGRVAALLRRPPPGGAVTGQPLSPALQALLDRAGSRLRITRLLGLGALGLTLWPLTSAALPQEWQPTSLILWLFVALVVWVNTGLMSFIDLPPRLERLRRRPWGLVALMLVELTAYTGFWITAFWMMDGQALRHVVAPLVALHLLAAKLLLPGQTEVVVTALWRARDLDVPELRREAGPGTPDRAGLPLDGGR